MLFPLYEEIFEDWTTKGTSVFLNNKLVLNPEGQALYGLAYSNYIFQKPNWEMQIDLEIANRRDNPMGFGGTKIYLIKDNPEQSVEKFNFGLSNKFRGLMLQINNNS